METRAVPCGSKLPLQPEEEPCLQLFLEIPALAAPTQTLKFQPWRTLGLGWNSCFWSAAQQTVQLLLGAVLYIQAHTPWLWQGFLKQCHPPHWYFTELGNPKMTLLPGHFQPLKSKMLGFTFLKYLFEMLIPQCSWESSGWILHKLC